MSRFQRNLNTFCDSLTENNAVNKTSINTCHGKKLQILLHCRKRYTRDFLGNRVSLFFWRTSLLYLFPVVSISISKAFQFLYKHFISFSKFWKHIYWKWSMNRKWIPVIGSNWLQINGLKAIKISKETFMKMLAFFPEVIRVMLAILKNIKVFEVSKAHIIQGVNNELKFYN